MKYLERLEKTAKTMVAKGKGILAADESTGTITKRLAQVNVISTFETRLAYRELLFTTPGLGEFISGTILYDETIRQILSDGRTVPQALKDQGIIPGIKVDTGAQDFANHPNEKITEGLDGLRDRLTEYDKLGAGFAKWRTVITIGDDIPSNACILANAHALARYAALCQETGIVPIVEPEVIMNGKHTIETCYDVTLHSQKVVFDELQKQGVILSGIILKPSMVISGDECSVQADMEKVSEQTVKCLSETVPADVPGCAFLSGGQSDLDATHHLNYMNENFADKLNWNLTFSYGRALQQTALKTWSGKPENEEAAQDVLYHRAKCNGFASKGEYSSVMESELVLAY